MAQIAFKLPEQKRIPWARTVRAEFPEKIVSRKKVILTGFCKSVE